MRRLIYAITLLTLSSPAAGSASFPVESFQNAEIHLEDAGGDLDNAFRALARRIDEPAWIGYTVPRIAGGPRITAGRFDGHDAVEGCGVLYLEKRRGHESYHDRDADGGDVLVLLRVAGGQVGKIRAASPDCVIDAGGLPVHGFSSVDPRQSVDLLVSVADTGGRKSIDEALMAIALHDVPAVDGILERAATGELDWRHEEQAVFWLGAARGRRGYEILRRLLASEDDAELRAHVVFGIYISEDDDSVETLIELARHDCHRKVRSQALFWLGQQAGERAVAELERLAVEDPEIEIKKAAIFALSQLPPEKAVPLLIRQARSHPHPEVRKQAFFWLGQTDDERALDFIEEVLLQ